MKTINFNKKIYTGKAVRQAVKSFSALADFKISENRKYFTVKIGGADKNDETALAGEFSNFVLSVCEKK